MDARKVKFEIFKKDSTKQFLEILVDVKFGKSYLSNPDQRIDQKSQKGGTCFYYALNYLRPRFGKFFDESYPGRDIEKKISNFRKIMTELSKLHEHLLFFAKAITHDKEILKKMIQSDSIEFIKITGKVFFELINYFIGHDKFSLEGLINLHIAYVTIESAKNLLVDLGIKPDDAIKEYKNKYFPKIANELSFGEEGSLLTGATYEIIADKYHIKYTKWYPAQAFIGLAEAIEREGAIAVSCDFSDFSIATSKPLQQKFGKWDVYGWNESDFLITEKRKSDFNIINRHRILIVGLQQYGNDQYVVYMDPNSPNTADGPNVIFKIPYKFFINCLTSVHTWHKEEQRKVGPYGYVAQ